MITRRKPDVTTVVVAPAVQRRDPSRRGLSGRTVSAGEELKLPRQVKLRRAMPIRAYIGPNGHGKSLAAVVDLMASLERGRPVLSTVPLLDWRAEPDPEVYVLDEELGYWVSRETGVMWQRPTHPSYVRLTKWSQIAAASHCDVFLDEVAGVASSRQGQNMPAAVEKLLQKLRHADITLSWTAPSWARADLIIRETTQAVTVCEGYRRERHEVDGRVWLRNRQFDWVTYDAAMYTDWTDGKRDKAKRLCKQRFWLPGSAASRAYDSLGAVDTIASVTDAGRCVECGGRRVAPDCVCDDYVTDRAERKALRAHAASAASTDAARPAGRHLAVSPTS